MSKAAISAELAQERARVEAARNALMSALAAHDAGLASAIADFDAHLDRLRDLRREIADTRRAAAEMFASAAPQPPAREPKGPLCEGCGVEPGQQHSLECREYWQPRTVQHHRV